MSRLFIIILVAALMAPSISSSGAFLSSDSTVRKSFRKSKPRYYLTVGMGSLIGCENCKFTGTTAGFTTSIVQGLRLGRKASVGAGIGFDAYENWKTLPLFGSASWDLFGRSNKVFVQLNYGYAYARINKNAKDYGYVESNGGKMINPMLGYQIQSGNLRVVLSLGYKFQRVRSQYSYPNYYPYPTYESFVPSPASTKEIQKDMNRFVVGMAIGWK